MTRDQFLALDFKEANDGKWMKDAVHFVSPDDIVPIGEEQILRANFTARQLYILLGDHLRLGFSLPKCHVAMLHYSIIYLLID